MSITGLAAGVVIGAVIGYGTNYIAVKMLFRPLRQVRIGVITVPLTPGVIPRRQGQLAKALGRAVADTLFTKDDLKRMLVSDEIRESVVERLMDGVKRSAASGMGLREGVLDFVPEYLYDQSRERLSDALTTALAGEIQKLDIGEIILDEGRQAVNEHLSDTMIGMFLNESVLTAVTEPVGKRVEAYLQEHAEELLRPAVEDNLARLEETTPSELADTLAISDGLLKSVLSKVYDRLMNGGVDVLLEGLDIGGIVEHKVNMMRPEDIETLVLSVMKNELRTVVNLGALIGAAIGLLNGLF